MCIMIWFTPSCTFDKGEIFIPDYCDSLDLADSTIVSYACDIEPIIRANCTVSCHTPGDLQGTLYYLDAYNLLEIVADNGTLMCSLNWGLGCTLDPMPFGSGTEIDLEYRETIQEWINQGKPQ